MDVKDINEFLKEHYTIDDKKDLDESRSGIYFANGIKKYLIDSENSFTYFRDEEGQDVGLDYRDEYRALYETFLNNVEALVEKIQPNSY